jgi:hypothetical protein
LSSGRPGARVAPPLQVLCSFARQALGAIGIRVADSDLAHY